MSRSNFPSIFNDVIGPVMRGPSASHCAGALRIGRLARDLMGGHITEVLVQFHPDGSLATTHESQGSDIGFCAGLLGWDTTDERITRSEEIIKEQGIKIDFNISDINAFHPNTYKIALKNSHGTHEMYALSVGGGSIELISIDGFNTSITGDYFETLIFVNEYENEIIESLHGLINADYMNLIRGENKCMIEIKAQSFLPDQVVKDLMSKREVIDIIKLSPVLPVLSGRDRMVPFINSNEMLEFNNDKNLSLWELAVEYECRRGNLSAEDVIKKMDNIVSILEDSIEKGLKGTEYEDRILGFQSGQFKDNMLSGRLLGDNTVNRIILYVTAIMEVKSSYGIVVAAPTAGSCGALPGACIAIGHEYNKSREDMIRAMLCAGIIGVFIAAHSTFAAEVCGCQAECGAGSAMAAAALVTLNGGTLQQALNAASMSIQNTLGLICDPIANRVEAPCLGKNVLGAVNALANANMALAGFDPLIPLDEVIETMDKVGKSLPNTLRCTALGGLSVTKTSKEIEKKLNLVKNKKSV